MEDKVREGLCEISKYVAQLDKLGKYKNSKINNKYIEFDNNSSAYANIDDEEEVPSILIYESEAKELFNKFINDLEKVYLNRINYKLSNLLALDNNE